MVAGEWEAFSPNISRRFKFELTIKVAGGNMYTNNVTIVKRDVLVNLSSYYNNEHVKNIFRFTRTII